ncbi:unannotated protein [freshwater metagenome]|uniref:Unannotated protein n=1 Tax=freshwater metagenome TaxID=449393 RepID=A0A6J6PM48_9ZZZZ
MGTRLVAHESCIGFGGAFRSRVEQHLAVLARKAQRFPVHVVDVAEFCGVVLRLSHGVAPLRTIQSHFTTAVSGSAVHIVYNLRLFYFSIFFAGPRHHACTDLLSGSRKSRAGDRPRGSRETRDRTRRVARAGRAAVLHRRGRQRGQLRARGQRLPQAVRNRGLRAHG